ncbi:CxC2 domain-containing protein [Mycena venus]|uniref:CxC2 domain-containing protein n=1 Tax=Mycena venus TaxID=2733690 RepID=A0A8H7DAZ5_9AGAR|nr:CxC2 domain-containing protein [Mycena venus]
MKRRSGFTLGPSKKHKNVFTLQSFGHSLKEAPLVGRAGNLSADGRRSDVQNVPLVDREVHPSAAPGPSLDDNKTDWLDVPDDAEPLGVGVRPNVVPMRRWYPTSDDNLRHWVANFRDAYLRVLVTREGRMGQDERCECVCGNPAKYRCVECHGGRMLCKDCIVEKHRLRPLCCIELWNGAFFDRQELRHLGLRVQLGHRNNEPCPRAHRGRDRFVVIAPNGFHHVAVDFCQCRLSNSAPHWEQLLTYGWYPSMPDNPQSAITVATLKLFHSGTIQTDPPPRPEKGSLRWTASPARGRGVNLPEGWEQTPPEKRFLYMMFLTIDACFRLKRKKISSWASDPSLQDGWAYFVHSTDYMEYVKTLGEQKEMSTCTGLVALDHANTKYSQGYAATGCGMITCGRHEVVAKNSVGDLQEGEKYGNMDYIVTSAFRHFLALLFFLLSYDIMCQWHQHLKERLLKLPPALRLHLAQYFVKYIIPKLHILGHLKRCQDIFLLLYMLGAAQADMEGIERIWSSSGLMGASTQKMGPGSRQDTLDDFWHSWNWNKVVGMGLTLSQRFKRASAELARQIEGLTEFSQQHEAEVPTWRKCIDDFETGQSQANPYKLPKSGPTLREIELELTREEQAREHGSNAAPCSMEATMTEYLMLGLEIEGQQRQLAADMAQNCSPTTKELTDFVTHRTRLSRQIKKLSLLQRKYSPGALKRLVMAGDAAEAVEAEHSPLFLPSALTPVESAPPLSAVGLAAAEARLRDGQCSKSLDVIRHGLIVKKRLQTYKSLNSRHQHQNTRSRGLVDGQQRKVDLTAAYRHARAARIALAHAAGRSEWCALEKGDLRMLEDEEEEKRRRQRAMKGKRKEAAQLNESGEVRGVPRLGENTCLMSWIWLSAGNSDGVWGEQMHEGLRVEWCKAYTRVKQWREELLLLQEEMARCLRTLEWQACMWDVRATPAHYSDKLVYELLHREGAMALAARQAALRCKLANRFRRAWWHLTTTIEGPQAAASSESSCGNDSWNGGGGNGSDTTADRRWGEEGRAESAGEEEGNEEEEVVRRTEMDELLAIQHAVVRGVRRHLGPLATHPLPAAAPRVLAQLFAGF